MKKRFEIETPLGILVAEEKGMKGEYPGVWISLIPSNKQNDVLLACVEHDTNADDILVCVYDTEKDEPTNIIHIEID